MARSKYTFEKRQKEIARQKKQAEKATRKAEAKKGLPDGEQDVLMEPAEESENNPIQDKP